MHPTHIFFYYHIHLLLVTCIRCGYYPLLYLFSIYQDQWFVEQIRLDASTHSSSRFVPTRRLDDVVVVVHFKRKAHTDAH